MYLLFLELSNRQQFIFCFNKNILQGDVLAIKLICNRIRIKNMLSEDNKKKKKYSTQNKLHILIDQRYTTDCGHCICESERKTLYGNIAHNFNIESC